MKEIGGYIEFEYFNGNEYHQNALALNTASHAFEYLIKTKNIKKVYIPKFMCGCISEVCKRNNVEIEYYGIDKNLLPIFDDSLSENEWLYIVNFYGQMSNEQIKGFKTKFGNIVVDNVQAFFNMPVSDTDTLYSCRKFFGVADGAYLYTDKLLSDELEQDISYGRMEFLLGRLEKTANEFYTKYVENNDCFSCQPIKSMSKLTHNLLKGINYENVAKKRTENFIILHDNFKNINKLKLEIPNGAFMYPLYIPNGDKIRKALMQKKIYIPTLWPDVFDVCSENDLEYNMAKNILPLPIDQRYSNNDMIYIIEEIKKCLH